MTVETFYLDSSVGVRVLLGHSPDAAEWLEALDRNPDAEIVSSRILRTEITRVLRREGLPVADRERLLVGVAQIPLTEGILQQAEAIGPHVKTLDAIHLASALSIGQDPVVVTHDAEVGAVAEELGLRWHDPVL